MDRRIRVPNGITGVRKTSQGWEAQVGLYTDEEGFFGRRCPDRECRTFYKLSVAEYEAAPDDLVLTCPVCGLQAHHERFITSEQKRRAEAAAKEFARAAADQMIRDFTKGMASRSRRSSGGVRIEWKVTNSPPYAPRQLPTYIEQATLRTFECPNGGHHAVIYDLLTFCPWCGPDKTPPRAVFDDNLAAQGRLLSLVEDLPPEAKASIVAAGGATALAERALTGTVAASQNLAKRLHSQAGQTPATGNPWQNIDRLQRQWVADLKCDPLDGLDPSVVKILRLGYARRHVLEHNGGVRDAAYVKETSDGAVGRRVRIAAPFVEEVMTAVGVLADSLEATLRP
jgi:hypothetical protein